MSKLYLIAMLLCVLLISAADTKAQCGDANNNGVVGITDLVYMIAYLVNVGSGSSRFYEG